MLSPLALQQPPAPCLVEDTLVIYMQQYPYLEIVFICTRSSNKESSSCLIAAATGPGPGTKAVGWAAGCELLLDSQLAAASRQGPGTQAAGWAAGCELLFASPLAAATRPGPGAKAAGWASGCAALCSSLRRLPPPPGRARVRRRTPGLSWWV